MYSEYSLQVPGQYLIDSGYVTAFIKGVPVVLRAFLKQVISSTPWTKSAHVVRSVVITGCSAFVNHDVFTFTRRADDPNFIQTKCDQNQSDISVDSPILR